MSRLDSFLSPRSIAIVGASTNPEKVGAAPLNYLRKLGYTGTIYPVHPRAERLAGLQCFSSLRHIGAPVDLAIFAVPARHVEAALDDAISAGVKNIVMFSAGFAEVDWAGAQVQESLARRARDAGIRILGPNCLGFINLVDRVYATFSPVLMGGTAKSGHIGMVCQSGAFGAYAFAMARERGVGLSCWITTGNESDINVADAIEWMTEDPHTHVIMVHMEGCNDGPALRRALARARIARKPVVVVKVGRSTLGALTAATHTAALAGEDAVYDALFRQYGAWRVYSIEQFFDVAYFVAVAGIPEQMSVGILTVSGGVGVMMADDAADAGLNVPTLPITAQDEIRKHIPFASTHNPVDLTGQVTADPDLLDRAARIMLEQGNYGCLLVFLSAFGMCPDTAFRVRRLAGQLRRDFPRRLIIFCTLTNPEQRSALEKLGCPSFSDPARAIRVLEALDYFSQQCAAVEHPERARRKSLPRLEHRLYNEAEAAALLREAGMPVPDHRIAANALDAAEAAAGLGFPVAMKALSPKLTHKSEVGGVALDIRDRRKTQETFDLMTQRLVQAGHAEDIDGVLLAPMCAPGIELILGARRDPQLGHVIMLGLGGVHVEVLEDTALRLAPIGMRDAFEMISELRAVAVLKGHRGEPSADLDAIANAIVTLSSFVMMHADTIESVEINPLVAYPQGRGVLALDTVLVTRPADVGRASHVRNQVIQTLPLFEMARMRAANTARRHPTAGFAGDTPESQIRWVNQFTHTRRLRSPSDKEVVTPNNDTLFTNAWLDLSEGPLLINVPAMGQRYWVLGFLDAWTNPWAYAGRRTTGNDAQQLFIHGPEWSGEPPAGTHVIASPTQDVWVIGRILVDPAADDLDEIHRLQDAFSIRRLDGRAALSRIDTLFIDRRTDTPRAEDFLRVLDVMLKRNPPTTPLIDWPPEAEQLQTALNEIYDELREPMQAELSGGWTTALKVDRDYGTDYLTRARVARNWIGTLGNEEAMYIMAEVDAHGRTLYGGSAYVLRFAGDALPKVGSFWSLTLYGRSNCLLVDNPIKRHSIGDRTPGLHHDPDGGLSIALQSTDPGPGRNWLPTPPDDDFYLVLRLYQPAQEHLEGRFVYPAVVRQHEGSKEHVETA